ncbi:hypothetical protein ACEWY4_006803 [Coilia grayii]|uniref:Uncharacterized protein n=1 Tax=Coilia grayii TaxID=363190 RepID=A0ABD1KEW8_9TELE
MSQNKETPKSNGTPTSISVAPPTGSLGSPQRSRDTASKGSDENKNKLKVSWPPEKKNQRGSSALRENSPGVQHKAIEKQDRSNLFHHNTEQVPKFPCKLHDTEVTQKDPFSPIRQNDMSLPAAGSRVMATRAQFNSEATTYSQKIHKTGLTPPNKSQTSSPSQPPRTLHDCSAPVKSKVQNFVSSEKLQGAEKVKKTVRFASAIETGGVENNEDQVSDTESEQNNVLSDKDPLQSSIMAVNTDLHPEQTEEDQTANPYGPLHSDNITFLDEGTQQVLKSASDEASNNPDAHVNTQSEVVQARREMDEDTVIPSVNKTDDFTIDSETEVISTNYKEDTGELVSSEERQTDSPIKEIQLPPVTEKEQGSKVSVAAAGSEVSNGQSVSAEHSNAKVKQEKTSAPRGSWSKGKSPLSKLFAPSAKDKVTKSEAVDNKKSEVKPKNILSKLFQTSSDMKKELDPKTGILATEKTKAEENGLVEKYHDEPAQDKESNTPPALLTTEDHSATVKQSSTIQKSVNNENEPSLNGSDHADVLSSDIDRPLAKEETVLADVPSLGLLTTDTKTGEPSAVVDDLFGEEQLGQIGPRDGTISESNDIFGALPQEAEGTGNILGGLSTESFGVPSADNSFAISSAFTPGDQLDIFGLTDTPAALNQNTSQQQGMLDFMMDPKEHTPQQEVFDIFSSDTVPMQSSPAVELKTEDGSNLFLSPLCDDPFAAAPPAANTNLAVDDGQAQADPFDSFLTLDKGTTQPPFLEDSLVTDDIFSTSPGVSQTSEDLVGGFLDPLNVSLTETKEGGAASNWMDDLLS